MYVYPCFAGDFILKISAKKTLYTIIILTCAARTQQGINCEYVLKWQRHCTKKTWSRIDPKIYWKCHSDLSLGHVHARTHKWDKLEIYLKIAQYLWLIIFDICVTQRNVCVACLHSMSICFCIFVFLNIKHWCPCKCFVCHSFIQSFSK